MTLTTTNDRSAARRARQLARARAFHVVVRGEAATAERAAYIATLPMKDWKGQPLVQVRCHGTSGRGPHDLWAPATLLWSLVDPAAFRCPYHAGD